MIRRIAALGFGALFALSGGTALAQDDLEEGGGEEPAAEAPAEAPAEAAGGEAAVTTDDIPTEGALKPVRLGLLLGYGIGEADVNLYKLGFGIRAGYALDFGLYLGGTFVYHLGESSSAPSAIGEIETTFGFHYFGLEVGYGIDAGPVNIMPYLGLGSIAAHGEVCIGDTCSSGDSDSEIYIAPGAQILYPLGSAFIGADARYVVVTGDVEEANGIGLFLTGGLSF